MNVKLSNSQLNKLKSKIKNETELALRLSSDLIGNSDDKTNSPYELLLTNRLVGILRQAWANYLSTNIKLWKTLSYLWWYNHEDFLVDFLVYY